MYYKCNKGTQAYHQMFIVYNRIIAANKAANDFLDKLGYNTYIESYGCISGGIEAVEIKGDVPHCWSHYDKERDLYRPKMSTNVGRELANTMKLLPVVSNNDFNKAVGLVLSRHVHPGYEYLPNADTFILKVPDEWRQVPKVDGWVEITNAEIERLKKLKSPHMIHNPTIKYKIKLGKGSSQEGETISLEVEFEDIEEENLSSILIDKGYFKSMCWPSDHYTIVEREVVLK